MLRHRLSVSGSSLRNGQDAGNAESAGAGKARPADTAGDAALVQQKKIRRAAGADVHVGTGIAGVGGPLMGAPGRGMHELMLGVSPFVGLGPGMNGAPHELFARMGQGLCPPAVPFGGPLGYPMGIPGDGMAMPVSPTGGPQHGGPGVFPLGMFPPPVAAAAAAAAVAATRPSARLASVQTEMNYCIRRLAQVKRAEEAARSKNAIGAAKIAIAEQHRLHAQMKALNAVALELETQLQKQNKRPVTPGVSSQKDHGAGGSGQPASFDVDPVVRGLAAGSAPRIASDPKTVADQTEIAADTMGDLLDSFFAQHDGPSPVAPSAAASVKPTAASPVPRTEIPIKQSDDTAPLQAPVITSPSPAPPAQSIDDPPASLAVNQQQIPPTHEPAQKKTLKIHTDPKDLADTRSNQSPSPQTTSTPSAAPPEAAAAASSGTTWSGAATQAKPSGSTKSSNRGLQELNEHVNTLRALIPYNVDETNAGNTLSKHTTLRNTVRWVMDIQAGGAAKARAGEAVSPRVSVSTATDGTVAGNNAAALEKPTKDGDDGVSVQGLRLANAQLTSDNASIRSLMHQLNQALIQMTALLDGPQATTALAMLMELRHKMDVPPDGHGVVQETCHQLDMVMDHLESSMSQAFNACVAPSSSTAEASNLLAHSTLLNASAHLYPYTPPALSLALCGVDQADLHGESLGARKRPLGNLGSK